jgi:hypothetical protein
MDLSNPVVALKYDWWRNVIMSGGNVSMDGRKISIGWIAVAVVLWTCLDLAVLGNVSMDGGM